MIYLVVGLGIAVLVLAGRCWYLELVCDQLRTVNQGHLERTDYALARSAELERFFKRYNRFPCHEDGSGI
jgi:hypothetical protein